MKQFASLLSLLSDTTSTTRKIDALVNYFNTAGGSDRDWALFILSGATLKRQVTSTQLRIWAAEVAELPLWLVEETYHVVGDLAETVSLLLPPAAVSDDASLSAWIEILRGIAGTPKEHQRSVIISAWSQLATDERFVFNKLLTGALRIGVQRSLLVKALARISELPGATISHRLAGNLEPGKASFEKIVSADHSTESTVNPYPFFLAYAIDFELGKLGSPAEWQAEWKWDGIRVQIVVRSHGYAVWSRGEDLLTDRFPEFTGICTALPPGTAIDGEILAWRDQKPLPFSLLQTRIARKKVTAKNTAEAPVIFLAYDLLEYEGADCRTLPLEERREKLKKIISSQSLPQLQLSSSLSFSSWDELSLLRSQAAAAQAEGVMLKRLSSIYQAGRRRGDWWKWKTDPKTIDGVLVYAQRGHGRRADLYTDYTFAVWNHDELVPFAKAYSGLTDKEIAQVDNFVRKNTKEKFGPVRTVKPQLVFEIAFEGIQSSKRHKSGIALRFPRINRWRLDKPASEADSLDTLRALLPPGESDNA